MQLNGWRITVRKDPRTGQPRPIKILYKNGLEIEKHWIDEMIEKKNMVILESENKTKQKIRIMLDQTFQEIRDDLDLPMNEYGRYSDKDMAVVYQDLSDLDLHINIWTNPDGTFDGRLSNSPFDEEIAAGEWVSDSTIKGKDWYEVMQSYNTSMKEAQDYFDSKTRKIKEKQMENKLRR